MNFGACRVIIVFGAINCAFLLAKHQKERDKLAQKDIAEKSFIALNDVFADIFNVLLFSGKTIISEDELVDEIVFSQYKADDDSLHEQERDTLKIWKNNNVRLVLYGIENQTSPDRDMPFRVIGYDGASYRSQLLDEVNKERIPVVTIILYFGKQPWNYSKYLKDCFNPKLPYNEATELLWDYISDYRINVFDIPRLSCETVALFKSDFRIVAEYFINTYHNPQYIPSNIVIKHVDEFLKLMKVLTGDERYLNNSKNNSLLNYKEGVRMCNVLDYREAKGKKEGIIEGKIEGKIEAAEILASEGFLTLEEALNKLGISMNEYNQVKDMAIVGNNVEFF